jgi:DNA-binding GntR family transcriptional regulator
LHKQIIQSHPAMKTGRPARPRARGEVRSGFRVEEAYRHIKTRIMSADLPPGATVNEQAIAEVLGISRTPVREAIRKLEQEGLVMRYPNRGALVTQLSMKDVIEIWQLREILEPVACRLAAGRIDLTALAGIEKVIRELHEAGGQDYESHHRSDLELHRLILDAAGNATLRQVVEMLNERIVQVRIVNSPSRFQKSVAEHLDIVTALRAGDGPAGAEAMRRHLANARESLYLLT